MWAPEHCCSGEDTGCCRSDGRGCRPERAEGGQGVFQVHSPRCSVPCCWLVGTASRGPPSLLCSLDLVKEDPTQKMSRKRESESGVLVLSRIPPLRITAG